MHHTSLRRWAKRPGNIAVSVFALLSALFAAPRVSRLSPSEIANGAVRLPADLASLPAAEVETAASRVTEGRHLGFDTYGYPGDRAMRAWRAADEPYEWVGYYLPAPCHKDDSWSGKRTTLAEMGWGVAVIYVGQQTWGARRSPTAKSVSRARRTGAECAAALVNESRGAKDAKDAIASTVREGFARGTVIYLDIEYMDVTPAHMRDYYRAWVEGVLADGRYRPGIYAHTRNANRIYDDVRHAFQTAGLTDEPPFWIASGHNFSTEKTPQEVGHSFAGVWQGILDVMQTKNGVRLPIDVNVAAVPSPSEQYVMVE